MEEVEVHNGPCPLVGHPSGRMPKSWKLKSRVVIGSGCLLGPALGKESDV